MTHEATLIYSERILRDAVFAFWRRTVGTRFLLVLLLLAATLGTLVVQGDTSWVVGVLASVLALGMAFAGALYVVHYRNALAKFRAMGGSQASFSVGETSFTFSSKLGTTTLGWSSVEELWQFETVWLFLFSKAQFSTLPLDCISPEIQSFILQRIRSAGGRVGA
ncbi:YcxB family protein [Pelomonas sp. KK5]|uniref:YcxB family protein n=1 Tax=Pelomonas sp. KK5 TaxID=1855730 RepID=UPI00097C61F6|nr:YcxB family protein [Pelomonas sp. KK5]